MEGKIIKDGFKCKNNMKAEVVRYLWEEAGYVNEIIDKVKEMKDDIKSIPEELRGELPLESGYRVAGVMVLDDDMRAKIYDALQADGILDEWAENGDNMTRIRLLKCRQQKQEQIHIDCTGFLVYAIVKNPRCVQELRDYMEEHGEACYQAYRESAYRAMPFFDWLSDQEALDARLCLGLLEQVRRTEYKSETYRAFLNIANSGYKRMRNQIKRMEEAIDGSIFCGLSHAEPDVLRLSVCILGLVMAQDMEVPIRVDCCFYAFMDLIENYSREMMQQAEGPAPTDAGKSRSREMLGQYYCEDFGKCCFEYARRGTFEELLGFLKEELNGESPIKCLNIEPMNCKALFSIFGLNLRMLQGICLTEKEVQQLFSLQPEVEWEDYMAMLLLATVCKYIKSRNEQSGAETLFAQRLEQQQKLKAAKAQREVFQEQMLKLQHQVELMCRERDELAEKLEQARQQLQKSREQLQEVKVQLEQRKQELAELRDYVYQLTKEPEEVKEGEAADDKYRMYLKHRRVIVIGGHENWQRRFREYFPGWQFLSSNKNNYDAGCVRNKEIIIVNTAVLKHSSYYRIMSERSREQVVLYVHGNNPERCLEELERQLEARR